MYGSAISDNRCLYLSVFVGCLLVALRSHFLRDYEKRKTVEKQCAQCTILYGSQRCVHSTTNVRCRICKIEFLTRKQRYEVRQTDGRVGTQKSRKERRMCERHATSESWLSDFTVFLWKRTLYPWYSSTLSTRERERCSSFTRLRKHLFYPESC